MKVDPLTSPAELDEARKWRNRFSLGADTLENDPPTNVHPLIVKAMVDSHRAMVRDFDQRIKEYKGEV